MFDQVTEQKKFQEPAKKCGMLRGPQKKKPKPPLVKDSKNNTEERERC